MKKYLNYYVVLLFMSISLISFGFSSWNISNPYKQEYNYISKQITSENIYNTSSYLKYREVLYDELETSDIVDSSNKIVHEYKVIQKYQKIKIFKYFVTGFVNEEELNKALNGKNDITYIPNINDVSNIITNNAAITAHYTLDIEKLKLDFTENVYFNFLLQYTSNVLDEETNIFNLDGIIITPSVKVSDEFSSYFTFYIIKNQNNSNISIQVNSDLFNTNISNINIDLIFNFEITDNEVFKNKVYPLFLKYKNNLFSIITEIYEN